MFVSRKCLAAFIHLFARELSTCIHVAQLMHEGAILLDARPPARNPFQPVPKELMQRGVPALRFLSSQLDVGLVRAKSDVLLHDTSVHEIRAIVQARFLTCSPHLGTVSDPPMMGLIPSFTTS